MITLSLVLLGASWNYCLFFFPKKSSLVFKYSSDTAYNPWVAILLLREAIALNALYIDEVTGTSKTAGWPSWWGTELPPRIPSESLSQVTCFEYFSRNRSVLLSLLFLRGLHRGLLLLYHLTPWAQMLSAAPSPSQSYLGVERGTCKAADICFLFPLEPQEDSCSYLLLCGLNSLITDWLNIYWAPICTSSVPTRHWIQRWMRQFLLWWST